MEAEAFALTLNLVRLLRVSWGEIVIEVKDGEPRMLRVRSDTKLDKEVQLKESEAS